MSEFHIKIGRGDNVFDAEKLFQGSKEDLLREIKDVSGHSPEDWYYTIRVWDMDRSIVNLAIEGSHFYVHLSKVLGALTSTRVEKELIKEFL